MLVGLTLLWPRLAAADPAAAIALETTGAGERAPPLLWLPPAESALLVAQLDQQAGTPDDRRVLDDSGARVLVVYAPTLSYPAPSGPAAGPSLEALGDALSQTIADVEQRIRRLVGSRQANDSPGRFMVPARPRLAAPPDTAHPLPATFADTYRKALTEAMASLSRELGVEIAVEPLQDRLNAVLRQEDEAAAETQSCGKPEDVGLLPAATLATCLTADRTQYVLWDRTLSGNDGGRATSLSAAELLIAPDVLSSQPAFALLSADSFLRGTHGNPFWLQNGRGLGLLSAQQGFVEGVDQAFFWQQALGPAGPWVDTGALGYGFSSLGFGAMRHSDGATTLSIVGGLDRGSSAQADNPWTSFQSLRVGLVGSYDQGLLYGGLGLTYGRDSYGRWHERQGLVTQLNLLAASDGSALGGSGATAYRVTQGPVTFGPKLELRYLALDGWDTTPGHARSLDGNAGLAAAGSFPLRSLVATPYLQAGVGNQFLSGLEADTTLPQVLQGLTPDQGSDLYGRVAGGVDFDLSDRASASLAAESFLLGDRNRTFSLGASLAF